MFEDLAVLSLTTCPQLLVNRYNLCAIPLFLTQCGNMAREGLRTLVVSKKILSEEQYQDFEVILICFTLSLHAFKVLMKRKIRFCDYGSIGKNF